MCVCGASENDAAAPDPATANTAAPAPAIAAAASTAIHYVAQWDI